MRSDWNTNGGGKVNGGGQIWMESKELLHSSGMFHSNDWKTPVSAEHVNEEQ